MAFAATSRRIVPGVSRPYPILALVSSAHAVTHMYAALLPLVYPMMMVQFHITYGELGLVLGVSNAIGGFLQLGFGIAGRYVPRKILMGVGNALCGLSVGLMGFMGNFLQFILLRNFLQIAAAPQHPIGNSMITDRFSPQKRGSALSIHVAGGNLGTILVPVVGTFLIAQLGWQPALVIFSIPGLLIGSAITATVVEHHDGKHQVKQHGSLRGDVKGILSDRTILLIVIASMAAAGGRGLGIVLTYVPLYLKNGLHLSTELVGGLFTVLLIGSVIGPIIGGRLSDLLGRKRSLLLALAASFVFTVSVVASSSVVVALAASLILMGLFVYGQGPMMQTYLADAVQPESRDTTFGVYFAVTYAAGAAWTAMIGLLIDRFGFNSAFICMGLSYVLTFLILLKAREFRVARATA